TAARQAQRDNRPVVRERCALAAGRSRSEDDEDEVGGAGRAYSGRLNMLVWPPPVRVALSLSMATTRKSPSLSPTNSVLPLIMAEGRLGLKTIACNRSGAGLGGGGGAIAAVLAASLS